MAENDNFQSFFFTLSALETGFDKKDQLSHFQQLLYCMYIFYKEKSNKVIFYLQS